MTSSYHIIVFLFLFVPTWHIFGLNPSYYCAVFDSTQANGASGWFAMTLSNTGTALYQWSIELSNLKDQSCDLSKGLYYHLHTSWKLSSVNSAQGGGACGSGNTGGHYDPNFACSGVTPQCTMLNRTSPKYIYNCNPSSYSNGEYSACEIGDLSGKFGLSQPSGLFANGKFAQYSPLIDVTPPYANQYMQATTSNFPISATWSSLVFHCGVDKSRFLCAKLQLVTDVTSSVCTFPPVASTGSTSTTTAQNTTCPPNDGIVAALVVSLLLLVGGASAAALYMFRHYNKDTRLSDQSDEQPMTSTHVNINQSI